MLLVGLIKSVYNVVQNTNYRRYSQRVFFERLDGAEVQGIVHGVADTTTRAPRKPQEPEYTKRRCLYGGIHKKQKH